MTKIFERRNKRILEVKTDEVSWINSLELKIIVY